MEADPDAAVRDVLAGVFPGTDVDATEPAAWGNTKHTALVTLGDGREVVVQYSEDGSLRTEAALLDAVGGRTEVPVPAVLAVVDQPPGTALVTERVTGAPLHERIEGLGADDRRAVVATLGEYLGALHTTFGFAGHGAVVADEGGLGVPSPADDWRAWLSEYATAGVRALDGPLADLRDPVGTALADAVEAVPATPPARLFPWDFRPGNVVVDGPAVAAVLDWGEPLSAAPALSLAKAEYLTADWYADPEAAETLREAFLDGYERRRSVPAGYRHHRATYRLVGIVRSAVDSQGVVTRPRYPERDPDAAAAFHRRHLRATLDAL